MIHEVMVVGTLQCNCSIVGDEGTGEAMVVDPGDNVDGIVATVVRLGLTVKQIVVTHAHIDHIAGAARLRRLTGAPVFYNQMDLELVKTMEEQAGWLGVAVPVVEAPDVDAVEGLRVGGAVVMHTPGHTEGSICLHFEPEGLLLAGDTLFAGTVGRTDLPGGDMRKLMGSLKGRIVGLPEATVVIPGHGEYTTIAAELENNPFLQ